MTLVISPANLCAVHLPVYSHKLKAWLFFFLLNFKGYSSDLRARLLLVPYEGQNIAMIILLPDDDLDSMIESMNGKSIQYITNRRNYKSSLTSIFIPRFKYENYINMHSVSSCFINFLINCENCYIELHVKQINLIRILHNFFELVLIYFVILLLKIK